MTTEKQREAQRKGYEFDAELADLFGGTKHKGSGNRPYCKLDASAASGDVAVVISGKYVDAESGRLKEDDLDEALRATVGPEAASAGVVPILATKFKSGRMVATLDLQTLIEWLTAPPQLVEATKQDEIRATARTPSFLRGVPGIT